MRIEKGNGAPIDADGNAAAWVFWGRCSHEMFREKR
jgi:hypothetical protein